MYVHVEHIALGITHRDGKIQLVDEVEILLIHTLKADGEEEIIVVQTIVETKIGIPAGRGLDTLHSMQQRRIAQIAVERKEMIRIRRELGISAREGTAQRQTYY